MPVWMGIQSVSFRRFFYLFFFRDFYCLSEIRTSKFYPQTPSSIWICFTLWKKKSNYTNEVSIWLNQFMNLEIRWLERTIFRILLPAILEVDVYTLSVHMRHKGYKNHIYLHFVPFAFPFFFILIIVQYNCFDYIM